MEMSSPLYGPVAAYGNPRKSMNVESFARDVLFGFVLRKKSSKDEKVLPPKAPIVSGGGRKNTPYRKMLNELKNENTSKFAPTVKTCFPRNREKLSVNRHTSRSRILWIENGSWPMV